MSLQIQLVGLLLSLAFLTLVIVQVRRHILRPFYVVLWIGFSLFLAAIFVASGELKWLSDQIFAFDDSRHFVYIIAFGFLFIYTFYATIVLNRLQDEVRILVSELAILRSRLEQATRAAEKGEVQAPPRSAAG